MCCSKSSVHRLHSSGFMFFFDLAVSSASSHYFGGLIFLGCGDFVHFPTHTSYWFPFLGYLFIFCACLSTHLLVIRIYFFFSLLIMAFKLCLLCFYFYIFSADLVLIVFFSGLESLSPFSLEESFFIAMVELDGFCEFHNL